MHYNLIIKKLLENMLTVLAIAEKWEAPPHQIYTMI